MMTRRVLVGPLVGALMMLGAVSSAAGAVTTTQLLLSQSTAFGFLGHSCGGIQEQSFANGFDATSGYPTGYVYLQTRCGGSGRGGGYHVTTYSAWVAATWDFTGAVVSTTRPVSAPATNPTFSAFDANGNEVYNASNRAFLSLAPSFVPPPRVTGLSVTAGPASGGTNVTITGTGFTGATVVDFGGTPATNVVVLGDTSMTATSPATTAGLVDVTVTTAGGTSAAAASDQFTLVAAPTVSNVSPNSGTTDGGTSVTITGTGFTGATAVNFGANPAGFTVNNDTSVTAVSPLAGAPDPVDITVTTLGGTSATSTADLFSYTTSPFAPVVSKVTPNFGSPAGGTPVTITGTNFSGTTEVDFGGTPVASFVVNATGTTITTLSPGGSDTVDVTVFGPFGSNPATRADEFSYGPLITKLTPTVGAAGGNTKVTISGHNFQGADSVVFGTSDALSFVVNASGTAITATAPPEVGTGIQSVDVTVSGPNGTSPPAPSDKYAYLPPVVTKVTPATGSAGGQTKVTIAGKYLSGATAVTFGGVPAASFTVNATGTLISAITPPEANLGVLSVDVGVATAAGTGTLSGAFTYAAPIVTSISPTAGPAVGGTTVTIHGVNLYGTTTVTFGTASATILTMTGTTLTVVTPPGVGTVTVTVTTTAGTGSLASAFTY